MGASPARGGGSVGRLLPGNDGTIGTMTYLLDLLATLVLRRYRETVVITLLLAVAALFSVPRLRIDNSRRDLVAKDNVPNNRYLEFLDDFGTASNLVVILEGGEVATRRAKADAIAEALKGKPDRVKDVFYRLNLDFYATHGLLFLPVEDLQRMSNTLIENRKWIESLPSFSSLQNLLEFLSRKIESEVRLGNEPPSDAATQLASLQSFFDELYHWISQEKERSTAILDRLFLRESARAKDYDEKGYFVSHDRSFLFLFVQPRDPSEDPRVVIPFVDMVRATAEGIVAGSGISVHLTGYPALLADETKRIDRDMIEVSVIAFASIVLLYLLAFPPWTNTLAAVLTLFVGVLWTVPAIILFVGRLNMLSSVFAAILYGLGVDYGIHLRARYEEERRGGAGIEVAMRRAIVKTGKGIVTGALTTAVAFLTVMITDFQGFAELGEITGLGVICCLLATMTLLPALLVWKDRYTGAPPAARRRREAPPLAGPIVAQILRHPEAVTIIAILLTAFSLYHAPKLHFDYSILNLQARNTESVVYQVKMIENSEFAPEFNAIVSDSLEDVRDLVRRFRSLPTVGRVESIASLIPERQAEKLEILKRLRPLFEGIELPQRHLPPIDLAVFTEKLAGIEEQFTMVQELAFESGQTQIVSAVDGVLQSIDRLRGVLERRLSDRTGIERAQRSLDLFQETFYAELREKLDLLKRNLAAGPITLENLPAEERSRFVGRKGHFLVAIFPKGNIYDRAFMRDFVRQTQEITSSVRERIPLPAGVPVREGVLARYRHIIEDPGEIEILSVMPGAQGGKVVEVRRKTFVTGFGSLLYEMSGAILDGFRKAAVLAMIVVFFMLYLDFRSLKFTLLAMLPLFIGEAWMLGLMLLFDQNFNLANLVILPLILGIGVDNGVHIVHRFRQEKGDLLRVVRGTGRAILLSTLTTILGFGSLLFASHRGIESLGTTLVLGVSACLVAALFVLPALLKIFENGKVLNTEGV